MQIASLNPMRMATAMYVYRMTTDNCSYGHLKKKKKEKAAQQ